MGLSKSPEGESLWSKFKSPLSTRIARNHEAIVPPHIILPPDSRGQTRALETVVPSRQEVAWFLRERAIGYLEDTGDVSSTIKLMESDPFLESLDQRRVRQIFTEHADNTFAIDTFKELAEDIDKPSRELLRAVRQKLQNKKASPSTLNIEPLGNAPRDAHSDRATFDNRISSGFGVWPTKTDIVWADTGERIRNWERLLELIERSGITNPERTLETIKVMFATDRRELVSSRQFNDGKIKAEPHSSRAGRYEGMRQKQLGGTRRMIWSLEIDRKTRREFFSVVVGDKNRLGFHRHHDKTRSL